MFKSILDKHFCNILWSCTIVLIALMCLYVGGGFAHFTEQVENLQSQKDCEIVTGYESVTAYVTDINQQENTVTVQDTNGETWHFDNTKADYNNIFTITYNPSNWELLDYSIE